MQIRPRLPLPTRISRLYPLFTITLLITSSVLLYAWQYTQIQLNTVQENVDKHEVILQSQVDSLTRDKEINDAVLKQQTEKVANVTTQLQALEKDYQLKADLLTAKEKLLTQAQDQIKNQEDQLSTNATELESLRTHPPLFSFQNTSSLYDITQKEADVKDLITNAYSYIQNLYGLPYLLNSITITFVDNFSIAGSSGEILIENSNKGININIHLKDFDKNSFQDTNTIIHEVIHGFHGVAVFDSSALEEGMTVAATDAVMSQMIKDGKMVDFGHLYLTLSDAQYATWNSQLTIPANNTLLYTDKNIAKIYMVMGKAWYRFYEADPLFFSKLNAAYYPLVQQGKSPDTNLILNAIRSVISHLGNISINDYLTNNIAFNPS